MYCYILVYTGTYRYVPVHTRMSWYIPVCTGTYRYVPGYICMSRYVQVHTCMYQYIPVCTKTYLYVPVHTSMYRYIPVCTGTYPEKQKYCICITTGLEPATSSIPNGWSHHYATGAQSRYWICLNKIHIHYGCKRCGVVPSG